MSPSPALVAEKTTPDALSPVRPLYWSIRRELWENRSIYLAPPAAASVFLLGFLVSLRRLPAEVRNLPALDSMHRHSTIAAPYHMAAGLLMLTAMLVGAFYSVDAFQGERRDRSILFWKSLPVSDWTTVLAKASIPILVLPLLTFAVTFVLQLLMAITSSAVLIANHLAPSSIWTQLSFSRMTMLLLYHLITIHALWQAPLYAWLLLVSAWAKRAALVWAVLPPLIVAVVEALVTGTSYLSGILEYRLSGGGAEAMTMPGAMPMDPMTHPTPGQYLIAPGLWIGLALTAVFLVIAVHLRRNREPVL